MRPNKPSFGERIVTGLSASVVVAGLVVGCVKGSPGDATYPRSNVYAREFRPPHAARWVKIRHLRHSADENAFVLHRVFG